MSRLKIAMHIHSSWSYDAQTPIAKLVPIFRRLGANVMLMSEHDRGLNESLFREFCEDCNANSSDDMLVVPGIEYSSPENDFHILTWGLRNFLAEGMPVTKILTAVEQRNGVAVFAHPRRRDVWRSFDQAWCDKLHGIEIWNRKADGFAPFDIAIEMANKMKLMPTVGVDYHTSRQFFPLLNVCSRSKNGKLTEAEVLSYVRNRALTLYACGIRISEAEQIYVRRSQLFKVAEMGRRAILAIQKRVEPHTPRRSEKLDD